MNALLRNYFSLIFVQFTVRGRPYDPSKPASFNRPWTREEHIKLLQLLKEYPEEEVAAHRWSKISRALGTRTAKQVTNPTESIIFWSTRMNPMVISST